MHGRGLYCARSFAWRRQSVACNAVTTFQRPAPDLTKIVDAWREWKAAGDDVLPGRTVADLKIGGTDLVLETLAQDNAEVEPAFDAWMKWEKGRATPEVTLAALADNGFDAIVDALVVTE